jgi:flotillin
MGLLILFGSIFLIAMAFIVVASKFYVKVGPDEAIVKTGMGGMAVIIDGGALIWPVIHRYEKMDLTLKSFEIAREGSEGLICKDNIRADIKTAFFIRVDKTAVDRLQTGQPSRDTARTVRCQVFGSSQNRGKAIRVRRTL